MYLSSMVDDTRSAIISSANAMISCDDMPQLGGWLAALGLLALGACDDGSSGSSGPSGDQQGQSPSYSKVPASEKERNRSFTEPDDLPEGGRIFLDVSGSVQGFPRAAPATYETVIREVFGSFSALDALPLELCRVEKSNLDCAEGPDPSTYREPSVYSASQSYVAEAIAPTESDKEDPLAQNRVSVLISDGEDVGGSGDGEGGDMFCMSGPESHCLKRALTARAKAGYGIWAIGISLPFEGRVYAERGLDESMFDNVEEHVEQLRQREGWSDVDPEVSGLRQGETASYRYEGAKGLIMYVLSRDIDTGQSFADRIAEQLEQSSIARPDGYIETIRLAPYRAGTYTFSTIQIPPSARSESSLQRQRSATRGAPGLGIAYRCSGRQPTRLHLGLDYQPSEPELPPSLQTSLSLSLTRAPSDHAIKPPSPVEPKQHIYLTGVQCLRMPSGQSDVVYELKTGLASTSSDGDPWWQTWSTPNTYEMPERIYQFENISRAVLETNTRSEALYDRAIVRIRK